MLIDLHSVRNGFRNFVQIQVSKHFYNNQPTKVATNVGGEGKKEWKVCTSIVLYTYSIWIRTHIFVGR